MYAGEKKNSEHACAHTCKHPVHYGRIVGNRSWRLGTGRRLRAVCALNCTGLFLFQGLMTLQTVKCNCLSENTLKLTPRLGIKDSLREAAVPGFTDCPCGLLPGMKGRQAGASAEE